MAGTLPHAAAMREAKRSRVESQVLARILGIPFKLKVETTTLSNLSLSEYAASQ